jgi:(1->4)-alpha-D-glucan 1-alpha-D-glucosylmutase
MADNAKECTAIRELLQQLYAEAVLDWPLASWREIKSSLVKSFFTNEQHAMAVEKLLAMINADPKLLQAILQQQFYQLSWWQQANHTINYRRFFAVNELIATNMTDEEVFYDYHKLLKTLYDQKIIHGLRIDHIRVAGTGYLYKQVAAAVWRQLLYGC